MNRQRKKRLAKAADQMHLSASIADEVLGELRTQYDRMRAHESQTALELEGEISDMEDICQQLDECITRLNELAGTQ